MQSARYSFSFAPNPDWSRTFSPQAEIWDYLRRCVERFDIARHVVYGQEVTGAAWDDAKRRWHVIATGGRWTADALVIATGPLSDPVIPAIRGLAAFAGPSFHSAQWNHAVALAGRRVAVTGTGASAIQFVPQIQPTVAQLSLFQRTPAWVMPRFDRAAPAWPRSLYRRLPTAQRVERAARSAWHLARRGVGLPGVGARRRRLTEAPDGQEPGGLASQVTVGGGPAPLPLRSARPYSRE